MLRTILTYPNDKLRGKASAVLLADIEEKDVKKLIKDLKETMLAKDGLGLAAPQLGECHRVVVINTKDGVVALINPKITVRSWRKKVDEEGCLSLPGIFGNVKRHYKISATAYNEAGDRIELEAQGLLARVIQHEVDHLDGILFIDKLIPNKKTKKQL